MDIQLLSASSSPAMNTILSDATLDPLLYDLKTAYPLMSRQKVGVKANSAWDFGKSNTFQLNRFGILAGLVVKLCVADSGTAGVPGNNFGNMLIKRCALTSHSREVEQQLDVMNLTHVLEMPLGAKQNLMDLAINDDPAGSSLTNNGDTFVYVPLNFSFCRNGLSMALDLSFVEQIECVVELADLADVATTTTGLTLDASQCELMCYYYNLSESDLRKYEDAEFSIERPLSVMANSVYRENEVSVAGTSGTQTSVTLNFNCPNVVQKTAIAVYRKGAGLRGDFAQVDKIEYFMSGRLVYESTGVEEQKLENSLFYGSSYGAGEVAGGNSPDEVQNIYTHWWAVSNERSRFSGGVSGKNVSDWSARITFTPSATATWYVEAQHEYVNIVSISGASGKIGVSLSL